MASQWALYIAQERLAAQARDAGLLLELFHGRGGSPSRGGGRTYRAILAQPEGSVQGRIRITEQGETVSARYADPELAVRSLEQTVSAVLLATRAAEPADPAPSGGPRWSACRERSRERYRGARLRRPGLRALLRRRSRRSPSSASSTSARARRRAARPAGSSRCARSRGCSRGRRTGCCCRPGTAPGTALADGDLRAAARDVRALAVLPRPDRDARDGAVQDRPRRRRALPAARRRRTLADRFWPTTCEPSTTASSSACWRSPARARLLDETPALQRRLEHRNPWVDPLSHLQVELLRAPARRARGGARAAAGHDHRDRRRDAQHWLDAASTAAIAASSVVCAQRTGWGPLSSSTRCGGLPSLITSANPSPRWRNRRASPNSMCTPELSRNSSPPRSSTEPGGLVVDLRRRSTARGRWLRHVDLAREADHDDVVAPPHEQAGHVAHGSSPQPHARAALAPLDLHRVHERAHHRLAAAASPPRLRSRQRPRSRTSASTASRRAPEDDLEAAVQRAIGVLDGVHARLVRRRARGPAARWPESSLPRSQASSHGARRAGARARPRRSGSPPARSDRRRRATSSATSSAASPPSVASTASHIASGSAGRSAGDSAATPSSIVGPRRSTSPSV